MLPVAAVLAGTLAITSAIDLVDGHVPLVGEAQHIPELISVLLIWLLAVPGPKRDPGTGGNGKTPAPMRLLD